MTNYRNKIKQYLKTSDGWMITPNILLQRIDSTNYTIIAHHIHKPTNEKQREIVFTATLSECLDLIASAESIDWQCGEGCSLTETLCVCNAFHILEHDLAELDEYKSVRASLYKATQVSLTGYSPLVDALIKMENGVEKTWNGFSMPLITAYAESVLIDWLRTQPDSDGIADDIQQCERVTIDSVTYRDVSLLGLCFLPSNVTNL